MPALAFRQRLDPQPTTEVLARFGDGSVAMTRNRFGRGQAILWGTLLGAAYVQSGFPNPVPPPDRGPFTHTPLAGFRADLRRLLTDPALPFARRAVESSEPLVETGLLETERTLLVPLAFRQDGKAVRTSLTLDPTEFVVVER